MYFIERTIIGYDFHVIVRNQHGDEMDSCFNGVSVAEEDKVQTYIIGVEHAFDFADIPYTTYYSD